MFYLLIQQKCNCLAACLLKLCSIQQVKLDAVLIEDLFKAVLVSYSYVSISPRLDPLANKIHFLFASSLLSSGPIHYILAHPTSL